MLAALTNLQPTKKYFVTMFVVSCVLLALFTVAIYDQSKLYSQSNRWVVHTYEVLHRARSLLIHLYESDAAAENYMTLNVMKYRTEYRQSLAKMDLDLKAIDELTVDNSEHHPGLNALQDLIGRYKSLTESEIQAFDAEPTDEHRHAAHSPTHIALLDQIRERMRSFSQVEFGLLRSRIDIAYMQQKNYLMTLIFGAILSIGALVIANLVIFTLIARSNETEKRLQKSHERFRFLMSGINDGIFDRNLVDGSIDFSPACKSMLGYDDREFPNTLEAHQSFVHPDDEPVLAEALQNYADGKVPHYSCTFRMRHKDGGWRWILARGVGMRDSEGVLQHLVGTYTDITSQKQREEELRQLNADLEGFTYIASHDLRAPLVNLKGFSLEIQQALAQAWPQLEPAIAGMPAEERDALLRIFTNDVPESLGFIQSSVEKMDKLTSAILDLSRIGRRELHLMPVETEELVQRCLDALAYEINEKKIDIVCGDLPPIVTDAVALEQIFGNILDNAVKYLDPKRTGRIEINAIALSTEIIFSVRDNGRGIVENDENKVFAIFRRAGNSANIRGAGLGMAYVKATLRKLGGRIWFQSSPGIGTVFYVSLPHASQPELWKAA